MVRTSNPFSSYRGLVNPQRSSSAALLRLWLPWKRVVMLRGHDLLLIDVGNNPLSHLEKRLHRISDQRVIEWSWRDPLFESGDHYNFILGLESYHKCPKSAQMILPRLPLPLPHSQEVIQYWRLNLVDRELFFNTIWWIARKRWCGHQEAHWTTIRLYLWMCS